MVVTRREGGGERVKGASNKYNGRRLGFRWWATVEYTDAVLESCTSEIYIILSTNVTPNKLNNKNEKIRI